MITVLERESLKSFFDRVGNAIPELVELTQRVEANPRDSDAHYLLARTYLNREDQGDLKMADHHLSLAMQYCYGKTKFGDYDILLAYGIVKIELGEYARGTDLVTRAIQVGKRTKVYSSKETEDYDHLLVVSALMMEGKEGEAKNYSDSNMQSKELVEGYFSER